MLILLLALASLVPQAQESTGGPSPGSRQVLPVEGTHLVVRFVDDLGAPIGRRRVRISQSWSGPGWWRATGVRDTPRHVDENGVLRIPVQQAWSGELSISFDESGLFGHAEGRRLGLEWDGTAGQRLITIPRLGSIRGHVTTGSPYQPIQVSLSGATSDWYRGGHDGAPYVGPPRTDRRLDVNEDGTFLLEGITPGEVEITLQRGLARDSVTVLIEPDGVTERLDFDLDSGGGWIVGRVLRRDRTPLAGAHVTVERATGLGALMRGVDPSAWFDTRVDGQGRFRVGAASEGLYRIVVSAPVQDQVGELSLPRPLFRPRLVWCPPSGDLIVDLLPRESGLPVSERDTVPPRSGIDVELDDPGRRAHDWSLSLHADDVRQPVPLRVPPHESDATNGAAGDGSTRRAIHFDGIDPGTYLLVARAPGNEPRAVQRVIVRPGERSSVMLAPTAFASLVLGSGEATVEILQSGSLLTWQPECVAPGEVDVLLRADGRAAVHHVVLAPGEVRSLEPDWQPASSVEVQVMFQGHETSGSVDLVHELGFLLRNENSDAWWIGSDQPAVFHGVPPGRYRLLLENRDVRAVVVTAGETTRVRVERR